MLLAWLVTNYHASKVEGHSQYQDKEILSECYKLVVKESCN